MAAHLNDEKRIQAISDPSTNAEWEQASQGNRAALRSVLGDDCSTDLAVDALKHAGGDGLRRLRAYPLCGFSRDLGERGCGRIAVGKH